MHDAVVAIIELYALAYLHVALGIGYHTLVERPPRAQVAPSEVGREDVDLFGLLHHSIVDTDAWTLGEAAVDDALLFRGAIDVLQAFEDFRYLGGIYAQCIDDGGDAEDEDAAVPEVVRETDIALGSLQVGLLAEGVDTIYLAVACAGRAEVGLNIAVARLGARGFHAERHDAVALGSEAQSRGYDATELCRIEHDVVGRCHDDVGTRVLDLDAPADIGYAGGRVAATGFEQDMARGHIGQLLAYDLGIGCAGDDPHVVIWTYIFETSHGKLQQRLTTAQHIDELLWALTGAHRPEATADAACHNNEMNIFIHLVLD